MLKALSLVFFSFIFQSFFIFYAVPRGTYLYCGCNVITYNINAYLLIINKKLEAAMKLTDPEQDGGGLCI